MSHNNGVAIKHACEFVFMFKKSFPYDDEGSVGGLNGTPHLMNTIAH
jgi:hypothetical protein